jgi:hypothetical protein
MVRATGKKSTPKSSSSTSTTPIVSGDNPTSTPSPASLQEATASGEARSSNNAKSKPKAQSKTPTAPLDPNDAAALLATLAEQKGIIFSRKKIVAHNFCLAEIDRLRKAQASQPNSNGIKRPPGPIRNLQNAMGLENDKSLYMNCRVSYFLSFFSTLILMYQYIRQLLVTF